MSENFAQELFMRGALRGGGGDLTTGASIGASGGGESMFKDKDLRAEAQQKMKPLFCALCPDLLGAMGGIQGMVSLQGVALFGAPSHNLPAAFGGKAPSLFASKNR